MKSIKLLFLLLFVWNSFSQNKNRQLVGLKQDGNYIYIKVNDGEYHIKYYNNYIVETTFIPKGESKSENSHAVVLKPEKVSLVLHSDDKSTFVNNSDGISIDIQYKPFQIIYNYNGRVLTSEKEGYFKSKHVPLELVKGNIQYDETEKIAFNLTKDEVLYGGGARALGMNRRGKRLPLYNRAHYGYETHSELMNFTIPLVVSSKKYMIHFDNPAVGYLDLDSSKNNTLTYETISGRKTYQVIAGNSWDDLLDNYTNLTGKQPLPPRWILGNFSSRFGYHTQKETEETIQKFKEENIPVDAVILDLYWFGKTVQGTMGNLEVDKDSFPNMKQMITNLNEKGVKTVLITEPFVLSTSKKWKEADSKGVLAKDTLGNSAKYDFYFGNTGIIDIYKKEGEQWFWNIYKDLKDIGVAGFWGDLGEPEVLPSWVSFGKNKKADEIHNIYGHDWARLIEEGYVRDFPRERPFILMRAGYSGSQRFGLIPWSGDVSRSWGGLQSQPEIALQMGMQGLGYMHSDLGGFAGANLDDNLYVRWLQYGVFQPIYRPHAQEDVPSEPVFRSDKAKNLVKKAIELRYKLLPYNYNLAFENNQKGLPLMRPIFFEDDNADLVETSSTYLWGKDFLITPILKDSIETKKVIFPKNANWFNFYTSEVVKGNHTKVVKVNQNYIPTYVRGGVVIPMTKLVQTTEQYKGTNLELHYYFDASIKESERIMYNDDGKTAYAFERSQYELLSFKSAINKKYIEFNFSAKHGKSWWPENKEITLVVHNINSKTRRVLINNKRKRIKQVENKLIIPIAWHTMDELKIQIPRK
ncbi:MAG: DUF5110 domain-containing protein [Flavobacteriaceae bacterium]|nr:DUF5110 domain-containing protein [Flavobacteriaceae bacterium]